VDLPLRAVRAIEIVFGGWFDAIDRLHNPGSSQGDDRRQSDRRPWLPELIARIHPDEH
jgi:hypothetical protein